MTMQFILGAIIVGGCCFIALSILMGMPGWLLFIVLGGLFLLGNKKNQGH